MAVVILARRQGLAQGRAGEEHRAHPVVHQPVEHGRFERPRSRLHHNLALPYTARARGRFSGPQKVLPPSSFCSACWM